MSDIKDIIDILNTYKENGLTGTDRSPISINETDLIIAELAALREENERLKDDKRELVEALDALYQHTKNNYQICGLNEKVKAALNGE